MSNQESYRMKRIIGAGIIGLIVVIGISIALSFYFSPRFGGYFPFHFGWLGGIFLLFIIFWVARWFFWPWRGGWHRYESTNAESILKERYAKGEITKEQFDQMMHDIRERS